jgi:chemotaxis protein histidine kinase CheA
MCKSIKIISMSMSMSMSMSNEALVQPLEKVEPNVEGNVDGNVLMEVLAGPMSKVSKVSKVRLSMSDLEILSKKYNFEVEEALRYLKEEKSEKSKKSKDLSPLLDKAAYPMPFNGEKKEGYCNGLVKNHGLYTQCPKKVKEGYCKGCEEKPYGTIDDRLKVDLYSYKDPKGNGPKRYTEVLKKLKISKENVVEEAKRLNITIAPIHLEEVVEQVKRGRPKTEKNVKEATGKKGRPKKEKKQVEVNNAEEEEDLFATLIAKAHPPLDQPLKKVEPNDQPLKKVEPNEEVKEDAKEDAKEESTDLVAHVAVEKVEKKSKKVKEADPAKEAEKQKKADEKAAKEAEKEIEKQKKAEEKAAKEAEKQKKAEEKAAKEAEKQKKAEEKAAKALTVPLPKVDKKKAKDLAPPLEKVEEEADVVRKFEHQGKSYYKSKNTGVIYNMEQEVVGKWNAERNDIDFEEEEEEEEYDD